MLQQFGGRYTPEPRSTHANQRTKNQEKKPLTDSRYTTELGVEICRRMSEGEPLRQICRDKGMPPESTVRQWVRDDRQGFAAQYDAARRLQVECWSDEIVCLANRDDLDPHDKRVRIDTLKWLMSKLAPRRYGDRLLVAGDSDSPLQVLHKQVSLKELTDDQLDALERFTAALLEEKQ